MKPLVGIALAAAALLSALPVTSMAQHRDHDGDRGWHGDIRHFESHDARHWQSGGWRHGSHGGRVGWWWVIGGLWYFYPQPVYPYPDPYRPPVVVIEQAAPPPVVMQAPVASAPPTQFWYYCEPVRGYYPYVASCPSGWRTVPATPPGAPQ